MPTATNQEPRNGAPRRDVTSAALSRLHRQGLALAAGAAVFVLSLIVSWQAYRRSFGAGDPQALTAALIELHAENLRILTAAGDELPAGLAGVAFDPDATSIWGGPRPGICYFIVGREAHLDFWDRPLVYVRNGAAFSIQSLGADGKPGGRGYDADLKAGEGIGNEGAARFTDFLFEQPSRGLIQTAGVAGVLTYLTSFLLLRRDRTGRTLRSRLVVNVVASIALTVLLAYLHIPVVSGH